MYLSPAWNQGIRATDAPYVLLLNPDTEWWSGTLADYVAIARAHPRAGIVGPMVRNTDGTVYPSGRPLPSVVDAVGHAFLGPFAPRNRFSRRYRMDGWDRASDREVDWVSGCCMLLPRKVFDEVGMLDESFLLYGEELDLATRLRDAGWSVLFTPGDRGHPCPGRVDRAIPPDDGAALGEHLPVLPQAPRRRLAETDAAARLDGAPGEGRDRVAEGEVGGMRAVVLVGGEGTRLRPLTETIPKPLVPLMDRPSLDHVLDHLARHGVHHVVLSSPYLEDMFDPFIRSRHGDPEITWITETAPLGTGGAIVNALAALGDEPFFALNGDILTDLDLTAMLALHRERGAEVTIALHHVEDARAFGLVLTDEDGRVREFREKPELPVPGDINAGTYLLDPKVLTGWTAGEKISIERDVFPAVIAAGHDVFGFLSDPYWLDLGTPAQYLQAHFDLFEGKVRGVSYPAPWVHPTADVDLRAHLGRWVAVGPEAVIGPGAQIDDSVIHRGATVGGEARIVASVLGPGSRVGSGAALMGCVLGEGSWVPDGSELDGARVPAGTEAVPE